MAGPQAPHQLNPALLGLPFNQSWFHLSTIIPAAVIAMYRGKLAIPEKPRHFGD